ncbi:rhizopine-binding protein [Marinobacterium nitratireducens]|uniref:Rhizopine-binding protein n=1 Tax=Marinobacterium nitratireducens TaxID=518897 RepID=A0A918DV00_9GAMM|nr:substrate-binding domain-containing protein [Marinobacterium nitratireducens]GGO84363.1 rhizopine-binding protein [Marinobacterium nitratireducens]
MKKLLSTIVLGSALMGTVAQAETIGVAMSLFDDNYLTVLRQNMQSHADELNGVDIQFSDGQGDIARQQSQVENFIVSGVDGIIVMLVDADFGKSISQLAEDAGIPLVFVNMLPSNMDSFPEKQAWVGSDEYQAGLLQTTEMCKQMGGEGEAVILMGQLGTTGQRGRTAAAHDVLASDDCKNIEVVDEQTANWMRTPAMDLMTNWISAGIQPKGVIANNDEMALGAIQALKASGVSMDNVVIGGVDATQDALSALEAGDLDVTVYQSAKGQGQGSIDTLLKIIRGETYESKNVIPFELVTDENLAQYKTKN